MEEDILNYFTNCHVSWDTLYVEYVIVFLGLKVFNSDVYMFSWSRIVQVIFAEKPQLNLISF